MVRTSVREMVSRFRETISARAEVPSKTPLRVHAKKWRAVIDHFFVVSARLDGDRDPRRSSLTEDQLSRRRIFAVVPWNPIARNRRRSRRWLGRFCSPRSIRGHWWRWRRRLVFARVHSSPRFVSPEGWMPCFAGTPSPGIEVGCGGGTAGDAGCGVDGTTGGGGGTCGLSDMLLPHSMSRTCS
jgi:hypothetical protein